MVKENQIDLICVNGRPSFCSLSTTLSTVHCKEDPIYVFPEMKLRGLVPNPIMEIYKNRSQTHECRNWERGRTVSFLGIFVSNFRYSVFAV